MWSVIDMKMETRILDSPSSFWKTFGEDARSFGDLHSILLSK